eukprot:CAMPEP_0202016612 /NCGR_PEP_ID=MMETSP0905-20130828/34894_1 /ASSEMBLY_ACC=CAM_ASM_000554 /TAXON_ID=420261 /ORGANISM="Thalassiosira antarctica, Strain CCMP982" /LENGTH=37 /DNA_ID= /DNA_START= /DNA_END= /DNA_ORIENTATION=
MKGDTLPSVIRSPFELISSGVSSTPSLKPSVLAPDAQ